MLQRRRRKDNISPKSHPSTTFINNLLHSKSTYFYKWWVNKNSDVYNSKRFSQQHSVKLSKSNPTGRDFDPLQPGYNALWKKRNWSYLLPTFCILALLVGLYFVINPMVSSAGNSVHAWDWSSAEGNSNTNDDSIKFSINSESSGSINAKVGETAYSNHTVSINLANAKGYALGISYTNDSTGLVNKDTVSTSGAENSVISGANNTTGTNMADNTWGYSWNSNANADSTTMVYKTVPSKNNIATLVESTNLTNNKLDMTGKLAFAVRFGEKAVAGHYTTNVLLSLAVQPAEVVFDGITTMQQMTSTICSNAKENDEAILTDTRDNKKYWITKLKDGNCWMTQNLDYDIKAGDFAGAVVTKTGDINSGWSGTQTEVQSWDPGDYYYKYVSATDWTNCGTSLSNMSTCPSKGNWTTTAPAAEGQHYHVGNYYSWNAATAGTGGSITSGQASASICPTNWKLPTSNNTNTGSFGALMGAYGLRTDNGPESNVDKVRLTPLYFIPAGGVSTNGLYNAGADGYYWSSIPRSNDTFAHDLYFSSGNLNPSDSNYRYYAFSVRCLANTGAGTSDW